MSKRPNKNQDTSKTKKIPAYGSRILNFTLDRPPTTTVDQPSTSISAIVPVPHIVPKYSSAGLRRSLHGDVFQLRLLILFLYRAEIYYNKFYLASELDKAQAFDDIVLLFQDKSGQWRWRFLQAKHAVNVDTDDDDTKIPKDKKKNSTSITEGNLLSRDSQQAMALGKYLKSVIDIMEEKKTRDSIFENSHLDSFVLCTNRDISTEARQHFELCNEPFDPILEFKQHRVRKYRLKPLSELRRSKTGPITTFKQALIDVYKIMYPQYPDPDPDYVEDFFDKFRLICRYPDQNKLIKYINDEMRMFMGKEMENGNDVEFLNAELATSSFQEHMLEFMAEYETAEVDGKKRSMGRYLVIDDVKQFRGKLQNNIRTLMTTGLSKARPEVLMNYKVSFREEVFSRFEEFAASNDIVFIVITKSVLLTAIKVAQFLKTNKKYKAQDSYIFLTFEMFQTENIQQLACSSFQSPTSHHLFVIESQTNVSEQDNNPFTSLEDIFYCGSSDQFEDKQLIIITKDKVEFELSDESKLKEIEDTVGFEELDGQSQETVLNNEILYQNKRVTLERLLNVRSAQQLLNLSTIERLLLHEDIKVEEVRTNEFDGYDSDTYVHRTLSFQTINPETLMESLPKNTLVIIVGIDDEEFTKMRDNISINRNDTNIIHTCSNEELQDKINKTAGNVIVLEYRNKECIWVDFRGDPSEIYQYLNENPSFDNISEEMVASLSILKNKINILVDSPGMGKSCLMVQMAHNIKKVNDLLWVVKVNLNDHAFDPRSPVSRDIKYKSLKLLDFEETETQKAITFLMTMVFPESEEKADTRFQRIFFVSALGHEDNECLYPDVVILFDGFDEISPVYRAQTLTLLKALKKSRAKVIWVTSRFQEKVTLERELGTVAYRLNPLTDDQQKEYMEKVWRGKQNVESGFDTIYNKIENLKKNKLIDGIRGDFTNVPLQLKMLTDVMIRKDFNFPEDFGLYELYREFTESKFKVYHQSKRSIGASVGASELEERDVKILTVKHGEIAFALLYRESFDEVLQKEIEGDFASLIRVGLLVPGGQLVRFVHLSFAEYFLALYVSENVDKVNIRNNMVAFLTDDKYTVTRKFLNKIPKFTQWMITHKEVIADELVNENINMPTFVSKLVDEGLDEFIGILTQPILLQINNMTLQD